ncbi:MAG: hypothetical protein WCF85_19300 [Rhodospirillaceae bacterium]
MEESIHASGVEAAANEYVRIIGVVATVAVTLPQCPEPLALFVEKSRKSLERVIKTNDEPVAIQTLFGKLAAARLIASRLKNTGIDADVPAEHDPCAEALEAVHPIFGIKNIDIIRVVGSSFMVASGQPAVFCAALDRAAAKGKSLHSAARDATGAPVLRHLCLFIRRFPDPLNLRLAKDNRDLSKKLVLIDPEGSLFFEDEFSRRKPLNRKEYARSWSGNLVLDTLAGLMLEDLRQTRALLTELYRELSEQGGCDKAAGLEPDKVCYDICRIYPELLETLCCQMKGAATALHRRKLRPQLDFLRAALQTYNKSAWRALGPLREHYPNFIVEPRLFLALSRWEGNVSPDKLAAIIDGFMTCPERLDTFTQDVLLTFRVAKRQELSLSGPSFAVRPSAPLYRALLDPATDTDFAPTIREWLSADAAGRRGDQEQRLAKLTGLQAFIEAWACG